MKYKVISVQERTSQTTGKPYKTVSFEDGEGFEIRSVGVFDKLSEVVVGAELEGEVVDSANGKFKNFNFPRTAKVGSNSGMIAKAQETKRKDIEHFQETKMDSIRMSGAMRDATTILNMLVASGRFEADNWEEKWLEIRDFFINSWDTEVSVPF